MKILIIEDEPIAAQQLIAFIKKINVNAEILGILNSCAQCFNWIESNPQPELIFSDIELLDGNVFNFYDKQPINCPIIFTTAYNQYLLKAFEGNGISYLLKPYNLEMVEKAIEKFKQFQQPQNNFLDQQLIQLLQNNLKDSSKVYKQRFTIKSKAGIYLLDVKDIALVQADGVLLDAYDFSGKRFPLTGTLTAVEEQLNPDLFFRINRSDIVAISAIEKIANHLGDRLAVYVKGKPDYLVSSTQKTSLFRKWIDK